MSRDRLIQLLAPIIMILALLGSAFLLPTITKQSEDRVLRYTNVYVEGAPPFVVIGTAVGALRGLIVDYLWIKANAMKEKGLFYEAMADADLITKLQPRFAAVWAFHGHNLAYNISVATLTMQERWEWVNAGIRLVRNQGLRYNPNDMSLHRELAFWYAHKVEGVADDAHLYYKHEFCREWHLVLGPPPEDYTERTAWIKAIADAPETITAAEARTQGVAALVEELRKTYPKEASAPFGLNKQFLREYWLWNAVTQRSAAAKILGIEQRVREESTYFTIFNDIATRPDFKDAWVTLIDHVRKRVLKDEYNMDPQLMYEYTRDLGPIDWRHGSAHALYWSRKGSQAGRGRVRDYDVYIIINNDSQQITAMQDLARSGRITYDPFSTNELPGRFPDPRWIDTIDSMFREMYNKHYQTKGAGGDRFAHFIQNFMSSAVCEWYRAGETAKAEKIMKSLDELFGDPKSPVFNNRWKQPLDVFVHQETFDQYQSQPHLAPRDVSASLRYGYKMAMLYGRTEVLKDALVFAQTVTKWFKENHYNNYTTMFGTGRIADLLGDLEDSADLAYLQMITDPQLPMMDRMTIWASTDKAEADVIRENPALLNRQTPLFRALAYDRAMPYLETQFRNHELSRQFTLEQAFPAPPGLEAARKLLLDRQQERERMREEIQRRDPMLRKS